MNLVSNAAEAQPDGEKAMISSKNRYVDGPIQGYGVVEAGHYAVLGVKDHSADLLVLDMIMDPGIDGLETYRKILELHPTQKAVIASGFSETDRVKEAYRLGAGAYIKKTYAFEKIGMAVRKELDI